MFNVRSQGPLSKKAGADAEALQKEVSSKQLLRPSPTVPSGARNRAALGDGRGQLEGLHAKHFNFWTQARGLTE